MAIAVPLVDTQTWKTSAIQILSERQLTTNCCSSRRAKPWSIILPMPTTTIATGATASTVELTWSQIWATIGWAVRRIWWLLGRVYVVVGTMRRVREQRPVARFWGSDIRIKLRGWVVLMAKLGKTTTMRKAPNRSVKSWRGICQASRCRRYLLRISWARADRTTWRNTPAIILATSLGVPNTTHRLSFFKT